MKRALTLPILCVLALSATGCYSYLEANVIPASLDLGEGKVFFVHENRSDDRNTGHLIASGFASLGRPATSGPDRLMPPDTNFRVTYQVNWWWEFGRFIKVLYVNIQDAETRTLVATGMSHRTSFARKTPENMVREVLEAIFEEARREQSDSTPK